MSERKELTLPTLYKRATRGSLQQWTVSVFENVVYVEYGMVGGSLMETQDVISGKNKGRANETSPSEQAQIRARQLWEKKVKDKYVESKEDALRGISGVQGYSPMLAFPIEKKQKYVTFPAIVQPKFDGFRCVAIVGGGKAELFSRKGKPITTLPHINAALVEAFGDYEEIRLDGELYSHEFKEDFNAICSIIKRDEVHIEFKKIHYYIYDTVSELGYVQRMEDVWERISLADWGCLRGVVGHTVQNMAQVKEWFSEFVAEGYEGAMLRLLDVGYEFKRSTSLLKIKEMQDEEFEIIGVEEGHGKLIGRAGAFVCKTREGKEFRVKMTGPLESLAEYLHNFQNYKGRMLTVKFQEYTPEGVPRFGVGIRIAEEL